MEEIVQINSQRLYNDIVSGTNIISGEEYQKIISMIAKVAGDFVVQTLGPYGRTTLIDNGVKLYASKDGWHGLQHLRFGDPIYNTLFHMLQESSFNNAHRVGDGTSTAMVVVRYLIDNFPKMGNMIRQADLLKAFEVARDNIIEALLDSEELKTVNREGDLKDLYNVAYVASNGDDKLSTLIWDIYKETKNPDIYLEISPFTETSSQIDNGYRFNCRPIMLEAFINDSSRKYFKENHTDTIVFFFDHSMNYQDHGKLIQSITTMYPNKQVLIFAPYFDDVLCNVIGSAISELSRKNQVPNIMLVQLALTTELDKFTYKDLSIMSRAVIFDYSKVKAYQLLYAQAEGMDISNDPSYKAMGAEAYFQFKSPLDVIALCAGHFRTFTLAKDFCLLQDYEGVADQKELETNFLAVKEEWEEMKAKANRSTTDLTKEYMTAQLHYIRLTGKIGKISIGGDSTMEKSFKYDVAEDAIFACKAAWNDGIIRGLNLTTLGVVSSLSDRIKNSLNSATNDKEVDRRYILSAVYESLYQAFRSASIAVLDNKYQDNGQTADKILSKCEKMKVGFNLVTDEYEDMNHPTIINSVTTDIEILKSAISILTTTMSSSQMVTINKMYDKGLSDAIRKAEELEDKKNLARAATLGFLDAIRENGNNLLYNAVIDRALQEGVKDE